MSGSPPPDPSRRIAYALLALMLTVFAAVAGRQAWTDALTIDESYNVAAGASALTQRDLRMLPEHALLTKVLAGGGALVAQPDIPVTPAWERGAWFEYTGDFIDAQPASRMQRLTFAARVPFLVLSMLIGVQLYVLGSRLFARRAGLLAAALWCTTPLTLGFGHLASVDLTFTATVLAVCLAIDRHLGARSDSSAALLGLACGLALLARHTGAPVVLIAVALVIAIHRADRRVAARAAALVLVTALAVVWFGYRAVDLDGSEGRIAARFDSFVAGAGDGRPLLSVLLGAPLPLEYRAGAAFLVDDTEPKAAFLAGQSWRGNRWWYFPVAGALRLPPTLSLAIIAGAAVAWRSAARRRVAACLGAPALALCVVLGVQPLNLGLRYALPVVAVGMVLAGTLALPRTRTSAVVLWTVLLAQVVLGVASSPHSIAWTPAPVRPGYRWVGDIDYAQDNLRVAAWSERREAWGALVLGPGQHLPPGDRPLVGADPEEVSGWVAVSAAMLTTIERDDLSWLRKYCPVDTIGGTVLIYRFDAPPDGAPGTDQPPAPCPGPASRAVTAPR